MNVLQSTAGLPLSVICLLLVSACTKQPEPSGTTGDPGAGVTELADRYYQWVLERQPERAYFAGVPLPRHDGLYDNSPAALAEAELVEDEFLERLRDVDIDSLAGRTEWITAALLLEELEANAGLRVCRTELWNVNQMGGWHLAYSQIAGLQPVATETDRKQALVRWGAFPAFADQEIANLTTGLAAGYSAPVAIVERVIAQIDGVLALEPEASPYYSPGERSGDEAFSAAMLDLVTNEIHPALARYRAYLAEDYLPAAREELAITANPDGGACYEASLRAYTTLHRAPAEVYELGQQTVERNRLDVVKLGQAAYGADDFVAIINAAKADPADSFDSAAELLEFSREMVRRAEREMPNWVATMPAQPVEVVPFPEHEEGTGRSAHYRPGNEDRPAEYRIPLYKAEEQSRGNAEATAFHETWPGHHLQVATAQAVEGLHPISQIIWFSGPGEGWARYSEALAEEMGLYTTQSGPILRRAWPARGMVVDPGIHLYGWTREQAKTFMLESGRFPPSQGDQMVDRIAILPGQLTAYDSGGLEILALRRQAEAAMGDAFDIREFHDRVLENGTIPLGFLRNHVEAWIASAGESQ